MSLQYTLAEALYIGELGRHAYRSGNLTNPEILALARRIRYEVDPEFPGPGRFKGAVHVTLKDGRSFLEVEEFNRGSAENPMTDAEVEHKFRALVEPRYGQERADKILAVCWKLENL